VNNDAKKFIECLKTFRQSALLLSIQWDMLKDEYHDVTDGGLYPFEPSFNELCFEISDWVDDLEQKIQSIDSDQ